MGQKNERKSKLDLGTIKNGFKHVRLPPMVPNKKVLSQSKQLQLISKQDLGTIKHGSPMGSKKECQSKQWEQQSKLDIGVIPKWIQHVRFTP